MHLANPLRPVASFPLRLLSPRFWLTLCCVWSGCEQTHEDDQPRDPLVCNGIANWYGDGSDESDCPNLFQCKRICPSRCAIDGAEVHGIPFEKRCDHHADCPLADDEEDCPGSEVMLCDRDDYGLQTVYEPSQICDGRQDCYWAEDEKDCPGFHACPSNGPGVHALPAQRVCDGKWDCENDEFDCPDLVDPYTCASSKWIAREFVCDGIADCAKGEDELEASCHQFRCEHLDAFPDRFSSSFEDPRYIDQSKVCDGTRDCYRGNDELDCP